MFSANGKMAESGIATVLKTDDIRKDAGVRIPLFPQRRDGCDGGAAPGCKLGTIETQQVRILLSSQAPVGQLAESPVSKAGCW